MAARDEVSVEVDGRALRLSNLQKVLFPVAGLTKAMVIDYYRQISPVMLTHLRRRALTMIRWPDGVEGGSFFAKQCPSYAPEWMGRATMPATSRGGPVVHCTIDDLPSLVWVANLAALELHVPMSRADDPDRPMAIVFDFDPGPPADLSDASRVALRLRDLLARFGLDCVAKTSGKKGLHVYVPLNVAGGPDQEQVRGFAKAVADRLASDDDDVLTVMRKDLRPGKVFIDWSQNARHKTTVAAYSLRATPRPGVSTPVTWDEVARFADGDVAAAAFGPDDVLARVERLGDLFAPVAEQRQDVVAAIVPDRSVPGSSDA
ncbi:MAG TPA: non-homologous end-joining DNA ligase [Acidimicrobiia bacterium]|nr:non-homologous end-joining DNA ligase [Acidimicrobiia bacterium]